MANLQTLVQNQIVSDGQYLLLGVMKAGFGIVRYPQFASVGIQKMCGTTEEVS